VAQLTETPSGPLAWRNWRAFDKSSPQNGAFEYALYTDALVEESITTGPYDWIETYAPSYHRVVGHLTAAIVLRTTVYLSNEELTFVDFDKPDTKDYLGGDMADEMAHLMSLALARRLRSGGFTRRFDPKDERGVPWQPWHRVPRLGAPQPGHRSLLPNIEAAAKLTDTKQLFEIYPRLGLNNARALARAARHYAEGLWIADDDPVQAWLRLVSALEAAASQWKEPKASPIDRLETADPELADLIKQSGDVADELAAKLAPVSKATAKFVEFTVTHMPPPPDVRPEYGALDWDDLEPALRTIYHHRSRDLHAGTPFPGPMCETPMLDGNDVATEAVHLLGVAGKGGVWHEDDIPMHLHAFAYIAGGALREWWRRLGANVT
jgi:hypothetical protein